MAKAWAIGAGAALTAAAIAASQFIPDSEHADGAAQFRREYIEPIRQAMSGDCAAQTKAFTKYFVASRQLHLMDFDTDKHYGKPEDYGIHNYDQKRSQT